MGEHVPGVCCKRMCVLQPQLEGNVFIYGAFDALQPFNLVLRAGPAS